MRTRGLALATAAVAVALAATPARADQTFDELATTAQRLTRADLEGAAWALTSACDQGDGPLLRLCRAVRDQRAAALRSGTWLVDAEPGAFTVSPWDPDAKATLLALTGCVACVRPIAGMYVVASKAAPRFNGEVAIAAGLHQAARSFPTQAAADRWARIAAEARTQFVVRLGGDKAGLSEIDGHRVLAVDVLGYRVYQPCDGAIVCASPKADPVAADQAACGKIVEDTAPTPVDPQAALPARLTPDDLKEALKPVAAAARTCFDDYGVPGKAKLVYTVSGAGAITAYEQTGDFVDTPTGRCIDKAAKAVSFPAVKKASFSFTYPINVQ
ncbi:MAG: hypothetical protein IPL61_07030 [Myxococcales bacterium]|nr:hypothetical protein [Myxococcales bacterium]